MSHIPSDWAPLQPILHDILLAHGSLSEFELFNCLKSPPYELFTAEALRDPLSLFQSHFIVFNALYQLQDTWLRNKTGILQIHCTCIRTSPWEPGQNAVVTQDKLRSYYLDWNNLNTTDKSQVDALLDSFWLAFAGRACHVKNNNMPLQHALDLLNLSIPYSPQQLKQQYRKKLHQHHPDKGGSNSQTAQLHNAYERLKANSTTQ